MSSALVACTVADVALDGKACPCVAGFVCDVTRNTCVRPSVDAGFDAATPTVEDAATASNIHDHGTFETGCASWISYMSEAVSAEVAHGGARSCRFCVDAKASGFAADDRGFLFDPMPGRYRAEAWVRVPAGSAPLRMHVYLKTSSDDVEVERQRSDVVTVDETWQRLEVTLAATKPARAMNFVVWADGATGTCFLLDDVAAYREP